MKRLSDYKGDEAIELWADLLEPLTIILGDPEIKKVMESGKPIMLMAKEILSLHKVEVVDILARIDDTPVDGLNLIVRLMNLLAEIGENESTKSFFGFAAQAKTDSESGGSLTESTEVAEN